MQGMSEYEFLATADTLTNEIRTFLYSTRGGIALPIYYKLISLKGKLSPISI
jgi:hypothetical protein